MWLNDNFGTVLLWLLAAFILLVSSTVLVVALAQISTVLVADYGAWVVGGASIGGFLTSAFIGLMAWLFLE